MKRLLCVCVAALLSLTLLAGCGQAPPADETPEVPTFTTRPAQPEIASGVTITTQEEIYPVGVEEIMVTWHNSTAYDAMFGEDYALQRWNGSEWVAMEHVIENLAIRSIGFPLAPGATREHTYRVGFAYGPLQAGRYRIAASFHFDKDIPIGPDDSHQIYAEFEIS